jgi:hypothetical protein
MVDSAPTQAIRGFQRESLRHAANQLTAVLIRDDRLPMENRLDETVRIIIENISTMILNIEARMR